MESLWVKGIKNRQNRSDCTRGWISCFYDCLYYWLKKKTITYLLLWHQLLCLSLFTSALPILDMCSHDKTIKRKLYFIILQTRYKRRWGETICSPLKTKHWMNHFYFTLKAHGACGVSCLLLHTNMAVLLQVAGGWTLGVIPWVLKKLSSCKAMAVSSSYTLVHGRKNGKGR